MMIWKKKIGKAIVAIRAAFFLTEINTFGVYVYNQIEAHLWLSGKYLVRFENGYKVISFEACVCYILAPRTKSKFIFYYAVIKVFQNLNGSLVEFFYCTPRTNSQGMQNAFWSKCVSVGYRKNLC